MINYILQVVLFQVLFLAIYDFFLSKETFFIKNRWYLLSTPILSFLIPFIKIPRFQKAVPQDFIVNLPEIFLSPEKVIQKTILETTFYDSVNYIPVLFWIGVAFFSVLFLMKLVKIIKLIKKYEVVKQQGFTLILITNQTNAFSFFNYVFLGKNVEENKREKIIQHELVHSKQKHSLDLLLFEFLKIVMWFNPMIYFYQQRITLVHEYISDAIVAKSETKESYINNLLSNFFQVENIAFINQFYKQSLIKKRIIMMTKTQSKKMNQLKYLVLIPVLASMLFYVACTESEIDSSEIITTSEYQGKIKIQDEYYFIKQNELGKTIGVNSKGQEVDILSLLPESVVDLYFEDGKLVTEFSYTYDKKKTKELEVITDPNAITETEEVSFLKIEKAPTFPGCDSGDKDCFSKNIQKHFARKFNSGLLKTLNLKSGRKRVFISFKIDKEGNIVDIKARAPHDKIEEEVIRVMSLLPKVVAGEHEGKAVAVKYSIPFTLLIE
ncbi:BlaR1 peptidase M56 [Polaribacter sp. KT25b]|uniref:M56 family metallopeptidase n=1 Tax=Polaribacter sp. KT25b TaxID=1855336 RepID=UPI0008795DCF|nr:M56 family metallopeptidase [Polaribacter sp. KT25b]SDR71821.1 BlaR1 peptidase M56 [Polaribacter sp. KT25b]